MSLAMTVAERDAYLLAHDTGVMIVQGGGELFSMPVWYDYEPGGTVGFTINHGSRRLTAIGAPDCVLGLTVLDEHDLVPSFVTVFGPVAANRDLEPQDADRFWPGVVRSVGGEAAAQRYIELGGDAFVRGVPPTEGGRRVEMQPQRWTSCDYRKSDGRIEQILRG